jgi:hypothetical protein
MKFESMVKCNAINTNILWNFIQGRSCKLSSQAAPLDAPHSLLHSAYVIYSSSSERGSAVARLIPRRPSASEPPLPDRRSSARRTELCLLRKGSSCRCFIPSEEEPPPLDCSSSARHAELPSLRKGARQLGAAKKSTAVSSSSHSMEMKL